MDLDALNRRFAINGATFDIGEGGLPRLTIRSHHADAEIYIYGAHVTKFVPRAENSKPVLFMSDEAVFQDGKAIRGGVPICFPWFGPRAGDPSAPSHGFVRTMPWIVESVANVEGGAISATFALSADEWTRQKWPYDFMARYTVTVGERLHLALEVINTGSSTFGVEEALHTYLSIGDIHTIAVHGLEQATYLDKMNNAERTFQNGPIKFEGETDRVYLQTRSTCRVDDPANHRVIVVDKSGSNSTVVWNPWIEKSKKFADFGDDEWPRMVCIETCNVVENSISLTPGASHRMTATISVEAMTP